MELSPGTFNAFLGGIGQRFAWRRAYACPCTNPASGASKPNCPLCFGKGRQWSEEVNGVAGITNQSPKKAFAAFGTYEPGDAVITPGSDSPLYAAGQFDRFRNRDATNPFSTTMIHDGNDKLLGTVKSLSRVFWLTPDGRGIVEGSVPSVGDDGTLTWPGAEPPDMTAYSISGVKYEEYYIYLDLPINRNAHGGAPLPKKFPVRKFDLFGR